MSRKPTAISYDALNIGPVSARQQPPAALPAPPPTARPARANRTLRDEAAPVTLYLHRDARKALKRYAFEQDVKVHDLLLEAVEDWFRSHGLREQVRVARGEQPT
jgi:hypothetical protein